MECIFTRRTTGNSHVHSQCRQSNQSRLIDLSSQSSQSGQGSQGNVCRIQAKKAGLFVSSTNRVASLCEPIDRGVLGDMRLLITQANEFKTWHFWSKSRALLLASFFPARKDRLPLFRSTTSFLTIKLFLSTILY